ncbi:MAG TPA: hypothetical protein VGM96_01350 [Reyranella sp.]|jgi:hypothetical protein
MAVDALRSLGAPITSDVMAKIFAAKGAAQTKGHQQSVDVEKAEPANKKMSLLAIVREIVLDSRRLDGIQGLSDMGRKLLGLPKGKYAQITLVETNERPNLSYTCIVSLTIAQTLKRDRMIMAEIEGKRAGAFSAWIIREAYDL